MYQLSVYSVCDAVCTVSVLSQQRDGLIHFGRGFFMVGTVFFGFLDSCGARINR